MMPKLTEHEKGFRVGFGLALAEAQRHFDNPIMVKDVMEGCGLSVAQLKRAGLEEYDLKELRYCMR